MFPALALVFALSGGLTVESSSPDAMCPPLALTRGAVEARLGSVELEGAWVARYGLVHRSEGDFVLLEVVDPTGKVKLARELPVVATDCSTVARVIALVLERYFTRPHAGAPDVNATQEPALAATGEQHAGSEPGAPDSAAREAPPQNAHDRAAGPPHSTRPATVVAAEARAKVAQSGLPRLRSRQSADALLGLWRSSEWFAPWIGAAWRLGIAAPTLRFGVDLLDHEANQAVGSTQMRRVPGALGVSATLYQDERLEVWGEAAVAGVIEWVASHGLDRTSSGLRLVPGALLAIRAQSRLEARIGPFVELNGFWQVPSAAPAFELDGQRVLPPRIFSVGVAFGLALGL